MYPEHRARFMEVLRERGAAAVIPAATLKFRNHDSDYRYRPDSDFWYLTGFSEPEAALVLLPFGTAEEGRHRPKGEPRSILFLREKDREGEMWTGRRLGVERAGEVLGVDSARPIGELWEALPELLRGYSDAVYRLGQDEEQDRRMIGVMTKVRTAARRGGILPAALLDTAPLLHELRLFKSGPELERMRAAAAVTAEAHLAAMRAAAPGVIEREIDALIDQTFRRAGSTGSAYTPIVAGGANACILHYVQNDQELKDGELCLIDAGGEMEYYASDITRTFPVNGRFEGEQRAIYELVLAALKAATAKARPGESMDSVHRAAVDTLVDGLLELGLLEGQREELIAEETYKRFYPHRTGHWLGLDTHDCGAQTIEEDWRPLEPGMVFTIEPGLYVPPDDEGVEERWRGIGVRIEDDVLITPEGCEILTEAAPREIEEVEAACRGAAPEPVG